MLKPRPLREGIRYRHEVRLYREAPVDLAGGVVMRGARCLAGGERQVGAVSPNVLDPPSKHLLPTANGSLTSPMSGRPRVGSMSLPSSICSPAVWWAGR